MSDPAAPRTPDSFTRSAASAMTGAPRRQARTTALRGAVLTAATAMAIATLGQAAPAEAVPTYTATHQKTQHTATAPAVEASGWSTTGSMTTPRVRAASALLADGRVLVTGGYGAGNHPLASSELYDPTTGTWTATGSLSQPLTGATATTLANGNVLLLANGTAQTQLYDPATGTWTAGASMPSPLFGLVAGRLLNGRVIVAGTGSNPSSPLTPSAAEYNPATNTWATLARPPYPLWTSQSGSLDGGEVLPNGKFFTRFGANGTSVYTRATNTWKQLKTRGMNLADHSQLALLPNGHVMIAAGTVHNFVGTTPSQKVYDVNPASGKSTQLADLPRDYVWMVPFFFDGSQLAQLGNGSILATGGQTAADLDYVYNPTTKTWTAVPGRNNHDGSLTTLANGSVLAAGGQAYQGAVTAQTVIYTP